MKTNKPSYGNALCLSRFVLTLALCLHLPACKMKSEKPLPEASLPLFNPHRTSFACQIEATKVPALDADADQWFLEAQALEDPNIYEGDRDYKRIVQLTRQAAERQHWKAMLDLASLYLEHRDPGRGVTDAIAVVREGIRLGIPAAYDRLGTYYLNGTGVGGASEAYALFQKAAEMGNPQAMSFLGKKMNATWDSPQDGFWANIPIATQMLECAFGQGDGNAAMQLYYIYQEHKRPDAKTRALRVLHDGVKLGCAECADYLQIDFGAPFKNVESLAPLIDKDRAERYGLIGDALSFNPKRRYPNLDRILPLPPAKLPPWDGKKQTLLDMAAGVSLAPRVPAPSAAANRQGRYHLDAHFTLCATGTVTTALSAPQSGFWQLLEQAQQGPNDDSGAPRFFDLGEPFCSAARAGADAGTEVNGLAWTRFDTANHNHAEVAPRAASGITRMMASSAPLQACASELPCPVTGIWQPWIDASHPMSAIVNQPWRQAWLTEGQQFPRPEHDWLLALPPRAVRWHLMEQLAEQAG